jgi:hypothetical protein
MRSDFFKTVGTAHTRKGTSPLHPYDKIAQMRDFGSRDEIPCGVWGKAPRT